MKDYKFTGYNHKLKNQSRELRKNMTEQERRLWFCFLRDYPIKFYRQRIIGNYIADFYCSEAKIVIEIDGSQHCTDEGMKYDENRTCVINDFGVEVIRFSNYDINTNFEGVCMEIDNVISRKLGIDDPSVTL
ncbi:MAG: endonuclease domain-containing protein [Candidatus Fimenecus sp.]